MNPETKTSHIATWIAGLVLGAFVVMIPLGYFVISNQYAIGSLDTETEISAAIISQVISANPKMWEFESYRLGEFLSRRPRKGNLEIRRILNRKGETVAESADDVRSPRITRSVDLYDSGVFVGRLEITRSQLPLLMHTGLLFLLVAPLASGAFLALRRFTVNALSRAEVQLLEALQRTAEEKAKSDAIIAAIGDGISIQSTDFKVLYQNEVHKKLIGDHVGEYCYSAYEASEHVCGDCPVAMSFRDGGIHTSERIVRGEGKKLHVEVTSSPLRDARGEIIAGIEVVRDITARKKAEEDLRRSETFLQTIIDSEPECIKLIAADGTLLLMNRAGLEMIQADSFDQVKGQSVCPMVAPVYLEAFQKLNERIFRGESGMLEFEMFGLKGRKLWLETHAVPFRNEEDEIIALLGITRNITDRKLAEEALRKSEDFTKNILESVGEGVIVISPEFLIVSANRAFSEASGMSIDRILGRSCFEVSHRTSRPCHEMGEDCPSKYTFETGMPHHCVHIHENPNGNTTYVEVRSYPMKDDSGKVTSVIETVRDITHQRKLEDQLRQSQKLEAVGQLAGGVAHDFNNILTAIMGYGNLVLMKMRDDDQLRQNVEHILSAAERAAQLTQGLLAYSRRQILNPQPVNLNELIRRVKKLLERLISEEIELKTILTERELAVMADAGQIEQVLMNLATNARDAMPEGGLLYIETERVELDHEFVSMYDLDKPGGYAMITVTDTGSGMDEETREKLFDPFFTTKEVGKGTGLGLAMSYGIIKQHKGYINVYSEPGIGTTFKIFLPAIEVQTGKVEKPAPEAIEEGTETILLAEDDEALRNLSGNVLSQFGYKVILAKDGSDAVERFRENEDEIQMLLLDVVMPKKNGREVYEEIRKMRPDIKVLFASGYTADIMQKKGIIDETFDFVMKPISPRELLKKVRRVLDRKTENIV